MIKKPQFPCPAIILWHYGFCMLNQDSTIRSFSNQPFVSIQLHLNACLACPGLLQTKFNCFCVPNSFLNKRALNWNILNVTSGNMCKVSFFVSGCKMKEISHMKRTKGFSSKWNHITLLSLNRRVKLGLAI